MASAAVASACASTSVPSSPLTTIPASSTSAPATLSSPASTPRLRRLSTPAKTHPASPVLLSNISGAASTPGNPVLITDPGRALRWARLLYYSFFAPILLYGIYVQLIVLKAPGRTPIPAAILFGRDTVFLTFHGNFHCTWYSCLCFLHALVMLRARKSSALALRPHLRRSAVIRRVERLIHCYSGPLFALGTFVGLAYYLLLHFHPLTRLRAKLVLDYDEKMALLHLVPMLFVIGDVMLKDDELVRRYCMSVRRSSRFIVVYGASYFLWTVFCVSQNGGHWPYPFQPKFTAAQHIMFVSSVLLCSTYLTRAGHQIMARFDRNRRRRLAARGSPVLYSSAQHVATRRRAMIGEFSRVDASQ